MPTFPSLPDLQAFLEVAACQSLSQAAERLGVTQPAVTLAMQRLERAVGATLLVRGNKGVWLTAPGTRLMGQARSLCDAWVRTKDRVLAARHEVAGGYVLGCHTAVAAYALDFLPALLQQHTKLHLSLFHDLSRRVLEAVLSMRCDMGLVINARRHPELVLRQVCRDEVTLWQATASTVVPDVLICDPSLQQTQEILRVLRKRQDLHFSRVIESSSLEVVASLTRIGTGVGILPANVAKPLALEAVAHAPKYHDELFFAYRADNKSIPAIRAVGRAAIQEFKQDVASTCRPT